MAHALPLHVCHVKYPLLIINRSYTFLHFLALTLLIYYRISSLLQLIQQRATPLLPHLLIFSSELILSFIWLLSQAFLWRPVSRTVFPERLPEDEKLPAIDVFICTADPSMEPPLGVMNTVISAMALDYPQGKLFVYLSDDGGCSVTLKAVKEAWRFAKWWVPFCRRYGVKTTCPEAYFRVDDGGDLALINTDFIADKEKVKNEYKVFSERVLRIIQSENSTVNKDHPPIVEVIDDKSFDAVGADQGQMPVLVYVSREKRPSYPHHFKAGALNALLRVSSMISNSPYILGLDCDMYCNDRNSAREAMCFHLDPDLSSSLAFVQFPQKFHNISRNDIYESELRSTFTTLWEGMDGLKGPVLSGTCYYLKREALYGEFHSMQQDINITKLKLSFGSSNEFIKSLHQQYNRHGVTNREFFDELLEEAHRLASCTYENHTKWGKAVMIVAEVGFRYFSVVEDYFTSFNLHRKGWESIYYNPLRPSFLGAGTTSLNDLLVQGTRWSAGLVEVGLSKFSPILYGSSRMPILQNMCYGWLALFPLSFLPIWILATIPQLCLFNGINLYPEVKDSFFLIFPFIFLSSNLKHIQEILWTGGSFQTWKNEQKIWMMKGVTSHLFGSMNAIMEKMGTKEASFLPTNKVVDNEQQILYQLGKYNFKTSTILLVPLCSLVILNMAALIGGMKKMVITRGYIEMFIQVFLSLFIIIMNYPILDGMIVRKDKGRIPLSITFFSVVFSTILLYLGYLIL